MYVFPPGALQVVENSENVRKITGLHSKMHSTEQVVLFTIVIFAEKYYIMAEL